MFSSRGVSVLAGCVLVAALCGPAAGSTSDERLDRLSASHRAWLEEEVPYLITERERDVFLSLETQEERHYFIEAFWRKRDPNPNTPVNEFKEEHYRRLDYANRYFGRDSFKPGWKTDRGRMYVLLGEPRERQRFDGLNEIVSAELWFYQKELGTGLPAFFYLLFFRPRDVGEYRLYHPVIDGPRALLRGRYAALESTDPQDINSILTDVSPELGRASLSFDPSDPGDARTGRVSLGTDILLSRIEESPKRLVRSDYLDAATRYGKRVSADYSFNFVASRSVFDVLLTPDSHSLVHYSIELDPQDFALEADESQSTFYSTLDFSLEVRARGDVLVHTDEREVYVELSAAQMEQVKAFPFAFQGSFPLIPGSYDVSVLLKNRVLKRYTAVERHLEIPSRQPSSTAMSDAIVAFDVEPREVNSSSAFAVGPYRFRPAADHLFALGDPLIAGVQVQHAPPGAVVHLALTESGKALRETSLPVTDDKNAVVYGRLDLANVAAGAYGLETQLLDERGAVLEERVAEVNISPRSAVPRANYVHRGGFDVGSPGLLPLVLGNQYWAMRRFEDAREELERAVAANNPELPVARWKLAGVYLREGQADRALELLRPLESDYPEQYEVVVGLGFAQYFKRNFRDAAPHLEKAAALRAPGPALLNALGECYEETGDLEKARAVFERSLALEPNQENIQRRLASLESRTP